ncbi:hypothetical protein JRO89_XS13G0016600 [Xanthoceras sorbifolium]|uniref:Uncharacterized protein n=1 Tax=Xanthoceras sorbifolium TaxID=99658 RepID=A0ABQ8H5Z0_9ROSI|nr:hypothetical protein JRO89_XS13G0016600 [Xanthoceras sorbifolium]
MPRSLQKIEGSSSDSFTQNSSTLPDHQSLDHAFQYSASTILPIAPQVPAQEPINISAKEFKISESVNNLSHISQFQDYYPTSPFHFAKEFCHIDNNSCYDMETINLQSTVPLGPVDFDTPVVRGCQMEENYWVESDLPYNYNNNNNMNELWQFRNLQESWGA